MAAMGGCRWRGMGGRLEAEGRAEARRRRGAGGFLERFVAKWAIGPGDGDWRDVVIVGPGGGILLRRRS